MVKNVSLSEDRFRKLESHIERYNEEMGNVEKSIVKIQTDIEYIKEKVDSQDKKTWWVITGVILTVVLTMFAHILTS